MPDCPYATSVHHEGALCPMDVGDHLTAWKALTLITPTLLFLSLSVLLASLPLSTCRSIWRWMPFTKNVTNPQSTYPVHNLYIPHALQEAFASGIVHPKLF